jgi:hypothetical protein
LELDYSGYCVIVLLCSWNKARSAGSNATIQRDGYGFTVAKLPGPNSHVSPESFAFSINVQQVFYCNAEENSAWKVVCHVDIRSRRSALQFAADENEAFGIGNDADYDALITDFGNDLEVPGEVFVPEQVYIPDMAVSGTSHVRCTESANSDSDESRLGDSLDNGD